MLEHQSDEFYMLSNECVVFNINQIILHNMNRNVDNPQNLEKIVVSNFSLVEEMVLMKYACKFEDTLSELVLHRFFLQLLC